MLSTMRIIITCGPGHEPIDQVRRLTNFSTGSLGLLLATKLRWAGHDIVVLKGEGATAYADTSNLEVATFSTGEDLLLKLAARAGNADAILHSAALCDYRVKTARGADGAELTAAKIPTRSGEITLTLEPAVKVLPRLRHFFPHAKIVGWKYELDGNRDDVLAKAERQFTEAQNDACVVNGAAWGTGFGFVEPGREPVEFPDASALAQHFVKWLSQDGV
jgi:phosphopantothenate---cysteine ligase (CTP)